MSNQREATPEQGREILEYLSARRRLSAASSKLMSHLEVITAASRALSNWTEAMLPSKEVNRETWPSPEGMGEAIMECRKAADFLKEKWAAIPLEQRDGLVAPEQEWPASYGTAQPGPGIG